jgi:hypothetical protein
LSNDENNLPVSFVPLVRRNFVVDYYRSKRLELSLNPKVRQSWSTDWAEIQNVLFGEFRQEHAHGRNFFLCNAAGESYEKDSMFQIRPDIMRQFHAGFRQTGWNYEIPELNISISWNFAYIEKSFVLYKKWMIDLEDESEMEEYFKIFNESVKNQ